MAWIRLDDNISDHPKFVQAGPHASWLWVCCLAYCQRYLTDGFVPLRALPGLSGVRNPKKLAAQLVAVRLLEPAEDGFTVHDYLVYNASAAEVKADKAWDRFRKELYSHPTLIRDVRERDANRCRYCGVAVNWHDRRSHNGGQFDHIEPRGPNTLENIVVACRGCNIRKNNRKIETMGMVLRPPPGAPNQFGTSSNLVPNQNGTSSELDTGTSSEPGLRARASVPIPSHPIPKVRTKKEQASSHKLSPQNGDGVRLQFESFWEVCVKKHAKEAAWKEWKKIHPDAAQAAEIITAMTEQQNSTAWTKEAGRYIPKPANWLADHRWKEAHTARVQPSREPWVCPHDPTHAHRTACDIATDIARYKADAGKLH